MYVQEQDEKIYPLYVVEIAKKCGILSELEQTIYLCRYRNSHFSFSFEICWLVLDPLATELMMSEENVVTNWEARQSPPKREDIRIKISFSYPITNKDQPVQQVKREMF